jgi:hypothetical protein
LGDVHKTYEKGGNIMNKTISQTGNDGKGFIVALMVLPLLMIGFAAPVYAGKGVAFLGGMVAGHVVTGAVNRSERRTQAEEQQAVAAQSQPVIVQAAPAPSAAPAAAAAQPSAEQRIQQLDKLAAGGYITPEEYKAKKQSIVSGL